MFEWCCMYASVCCLHWFLCLLLCTCDTVQRPQLAFFFSTGYITTEMLLLLTTSLAQLNWYLPADLVSFAINHEILPPNSSAHITCANRSLAHCYDTCVPLSAWRSLETKTKLSEPGIQKLERQNFRQQVKHAELYSDLHQALKREVLVASDSQQRRTNISRSAVHPPRIVPSGFV